jgi:nucleotide-binding universal stress UspA family protein
MTPAAPFSHVICWVDGSDPACRAAERATELAGRLGARLSFLAAGEEPRRDAAFAEYARIEGVSDPMSPDLPGAVRTCLAKAMSLAAKAGLDNVTRMVRTDDVVTAICATARTQASHLVVVGKQRANLVERALGTSVPDRLVSGCGFTLMSVA